MKYLVKTTIIKTAIVLAVVTLTGTMISCGNSNAKAAALVEDIPTFQAFSDEAIPEADITKIVNAGINTQSAINLQPWHFSVVTNREMLKGIAAQMKANMPKKMPKGDGEQKLPPPPQGAGGPKAEMGDSPVAIIVSCKDGSSYDAGLATEMMAVEATLLGYGTKIVTSPTIVLNGPDKANYKTAFGIPEDMNAVGVVMIGKYNKAETDAVTSATVRKAAAETVSYIK